MVPAGRGDDAESLVGTTIAEKYFVHQLLGRGGMGDVYKATLLGADRPVALKLLAKASQSEPTLARRFEREAAAASRLRHPNSIEVVDFGAAPDGSLYLAMEFVPGHTLAQVIATEAPLLAARTVHLLAQVLAALADAHANGVIHRDLKPGNVIVDPLRDPAGFVKVLDFGIAIVAEDSERDSRLTGNDIVYGTPAYMSPEQIRGEPLDARSDLYSAGVMLFEMLSGVLPFEAPTPMGIAAKHMTERAPRLSERRSGVAAPPALEALVARALEKEPALRPPSAEAMRAELLDSLATLPEPARAPPRRELPRTEGLPRATAWARRRSSFPARAALVGGAVATMITAALLLAGHRHAVPSERPTPSADARTHSSPSLAHPASIAQPLVRAVSAAPAPEPRPLAPHASHTTPQPPHPAQRTTQERRAPAERPSEAPPSPVPIRLVRGELNSVPTPATATGEGVLVLVATPWANVEIDGTPLGETPREVRLRAGTYAVRAVHPDLGIREGRVVIAPGERKLWAARYEP